MRQLVATALVALVVGSLAGLTVSVMAQSDPAAADPAAVSGINADKVDGKHAVAYTTSKATRSGKLVATNSAGLLPANIVKPPWTAITGVPAGFADGVDNAGVTGLQVAKMEAYTTIGPGGSEVVSVACPSGSVLVGGGHQSVSPLVYNNASSPLGDHWIAAFHSTDSVTQAIYAYALCLSTQPAGAITVARRRD